MGAGIKAAFSTLGCPGLPLADVAELAARTGFAGVELRAAAGEPVQVGLGAAQRRAARSVLDSRAVTPLSVASYVRVAVGGGRDADADVVSAGVAHGMLAADLGATVVRVFPGGPSPEAGRDDDSEADAVRRLNAICDGLSGTGVVVAVETHDSHPRGADVARLLDRCPGAMAIWDVLHTWRGGESPERTVAALSGRLAYVQVKDVVSAEDLTPLPPGDGMLPLREVADALRASNYRGWVSWEYERAWFPRQPALEVLAERAADWIRGHLG